jgi:hypothetical protein
MTATPLPLEAPFPWFGGKRRVAPLVWERLGADVPNFIEPFFGSGAVLLSRPGGPGPIETVNDADGHVCNVWRALKADPDALAEYAADLAHECDLHARHAFLVEQRAALTRRLEGDPEYYDLRLAGWWLWGIALWIGSGWCAGVGPWRRVETEAGWELQDTGGEGGTQRKRLHLGNAGRGVKRQLLHLGDTGQGVQRSTLAGGLTAYLQALAARLARVRICCGDWSRVCGPTPTVNQGLTAVFLDPPYSDDAGRDPNLYAVDCEQVAHAVRAWCLAHGHDRRLRIVLCGYAGEGHEALDAAGWSSLAWKAHGGYGAGKGGNGDLNKRKERLWFSPHCLPPRQPNLFDGA